MDRKAMYKLSYGLFILTAKEAEKDNGCIINTAIQAASEPNQLSICVNKANYTHDMIQRTGKFTVSVLSQKAQFELFKHFGFQSGRDTNKFEGFEQCARGTNGIYYITEGTNAYISVTVTKTEDLGSHTMFIGEITDMEVLSNVPSVTYDYYQNNIKPKPQEVGKTEDSQTIWRCRICGYEQVGEELSDEFIKEAYPTIGKGTVYRNLDILVDEGSLRKVEVPDGPNRFDFTLKNHYHVRCIKCGEVFDVDMDPIPDLLERIHNTHGIEFVDYDISFKGVCPKCREKVKEEQHGQL